jgi:hypothetical protein
VNARSQRESPSDQSSSAFRMSPALIGVGLRRSRRRSFGRIELFIWGIGALAVWIILRWF